MPSKTKNRRAKRSNRGKTRSQRGGDIWHTLSFGYAGTPDDPTSASSFKWSDWNPFKSDPNGKGFLDSINPFSSTKTNDSTTYSPLDSSTSPASPASLASPDESSLSNTSFTQEPTYNPMQEEEYKKNGYNGGKRSKSRKCHHKHKHKKSCNK
jgi:hypothetical protein